MTFNSTKAPAFRRSKSLLLKGIQAGLIVSPILFAAAPSQAATVTKTFTGFTDAFAPGNWTITQTGGGAATVTASAITLGRPVAAGTTSATITISAAALEAYKPAGATTFLYGSPSFTWEWQTSINMTSTAAARYAFSPSVSGITSSVKWNPTTIGAVANQLYTGSVNPLTVVAPGGSFGFVHSKTGGGTAATTTGTIASFTFDAVYEAVPGPLPLAAAAAGFAWSRKLRRRLKTAQFTA